MRASRAPRPRNAAEECVSTDTILETNLPLLELPRVEELRPPHARALRQQLAARVSFAGHGTARTRAKRLRPSAVGSIRCCGMHAFILRSMTSTVAVSCAALFVSLTNFLCRSVKSCLTEATIPS